MRLSSLLDLATIPLLARIALTETVPSNEYRDSQHVMSHQLKAESRSEIQQALYAFGVFLDTKEYESLRTVFTHDIVTNVFGDPPITNIDDLIAGYKDSRPYTSLHSSTNEFIHHLSGKSAKVVSYNTALFFGEGRRRPGDDARGPGADQLLTFYDIFHDDFVKTGGKWKIAKRHFTNLVSS